MDGPFISLKLGCDLRFKNAKISHFGTFKSWLKPNSYKRVVYHFKDELPHAVESQKFPYWDIWL